MNPVVIQHLGDKTSSALLVSYPRAGWWTWSLTGHDLDGAAELALLHEGLPGVG